MVAQRRQPARGSVRIDRSNALGRKVVEYLPLNGNPLAVVSKAQLALGAGGSYVGSPKGVGLRSNGASAAGSIPLNLSKYNVLTFAFSLYWDAYANDDDFALEFTGNANENAGGFYVDPNNATGQWVVAPNGNSSGTRPWLVSRSAASAGAWHRFAVTIDIVTQAVTVAVDGQAVSAVPNGGSSVGTTFANSTLYLFSRGNAALFGAGNLQDLTIYQGALTAAEFAQDYANPWQIVQSAPAFPYAALTAAAPVVDTSLTGTAAAVASATGGLTTSIWLAASASALASASASLSTQILLGAAAIATASAAGALTTAIRLAGAASAQASATGNLTNAIPLSGSAVASASASASLAGSAAALSGAAVATAAASGQLSTQIPLAGAAVAQAAASASLTANGQGLSGAATTSASASGALTTAIALSGAAVAQASATGTFSGSAAALSGAALALAVASGQLATQIILSGAAAGQAGAGGALTTSIRLTGGAIAVSRASADLTVGVRYARAPDGPGYSRPFTNTTRPAQVNTRRP